MIPILKVEVWRRHTCSLLAGRGSVFPASIALVCAIYLPASLWGQTNPWTSGTGGTIYYNGGNVGIATTNPQARLEVDGVPLGTSAGATSPLLSLNNTNGNGNYLSIFQLRTTNGTSWTTATTRIQQGTDLINQGYIDFNPSGGAINGGLDGMALGVGGTEYVRLSATGNVGIGTTSPSNPLHIWGAGAYPQVNINGSSTPGLPTGLTFRIDSTDMWTFSGTSDPNDSDGYNFAFRQQGAPRLFFRWNGNVGIGTTSPEYKLSVNGTMQAKEVIVNTGWADYVFRPGYRIKPLTEVAAFIQANHHLPEIPSEAEIQAKGISLGEMQVKLLAKIEELTLQMIEINQKNIKLDQKNKDLQERVTRLEQPQGSPSLLTTRHTKQKKRVR